MMIARGTAEGRELLLLGLSRANVERLTNENPLMVTAVTHPGIPEGWEIVIAFSETRGGHGEESGAGDFTQDIASHGLPTMTKTERYDEIARAVPKAKMEMIKAQEAMELLRESLEQLEEQCRQIRSLDPDTTNPELDRVCKRFERLRELRNMMEIGSLGIQVNRAMDVTWMALP